MRAPLIIPFPPSLAQCQCRSGACILVRHLALLETPQMNAVSPASALLFVCSLGPSLALNLSLLRHGECQWIHPGPAVFDGTSALRY